MLILDSTGLALRGFVWTSPRTTNLDYMASYVDHTSSALTPGSTTGTLSSTSATDLVAAPASSTQRQIVYFSLFNNDTEPALVTLLYTSSVKVYAGWLEPGFRLEYNDGYGWKMYANDGVPVSAFGESQVAAVIGGGDYPSHTGSLFKNFYRSPLSDSSALTGTLTITSGSTFVSYLGAYAGERPNGTGTPTNPPVISVRYNVTTAAVTITWAEVAIYMGRPTGGTATLRLLGYADVSGTVNSTGLKTTAVTCNRANSGVYIPPGIGIWAAFGNSASTAMVIRAGTNTGRIQSGGFLSSAIRPSTAGDTVAITENTSNAPPWVTATVGT